MAKVWAIEPNAMHTYLETRDSMPIESLTARLEEKTITGEEDDKKGLVKAGLATAGAGFLLSSAALADETIGISFTELPLVYSGKLKGKPAPEII